MQGNKRDQYVWSSTTELRRLAPTAGFEPATSRVSSEVTDLYATCKISGTREQAGAASGPEPTGLGRIEVAAPYATSILNWRARRGSNSPAPARQAGPVTSWVRARLGKLMGPEGVRTFNPRLKRPLRCRLRHDPELVGPRGFAPRSPANRAGVLPLDDRPLSSVFLAGTVTLALQAARLETGVPIRVGTDRCGRVSRPSLCRHARHGLPAPPAFPSQKP